jgi:hypothetical protein
MITSRVPQKRSGWLLVASRMTTVDVPPKDPPDDENEEDEEDEQPAVIREPDEC